MKPIPAWRAFEELSARIQRSLNPAARIVVGERIRGRSGVLRKVDVTVRARMAACEVLVAFDCKRHTRKLGVTHVAAFADQCRDIGANLGVLIANSGFTDGAVRIAKGGTVMLQTLKEAEALEWERAVGPSSWASLIAAIPTEVEAWATTPDGGKISVSLETAVIDREGRRLSSVREAFMKAWGAQRQARRIGRIRAEIATQTGEVFIQGAVGIQEIALIDVSAVLVAKRWPIHLKFDHGHVLRDSDGNARFKSLVSSGFEWQRVLKEQPGTPLTAEEFRGAMQNPSIECDVSKAKRFLRVVLESQPGAVTA